MPAPDRVTDERHSFAVTVDDAIRYARHIEQGRAERLVRAHKANALKESDAFGDSMRRAVEDMERDLAATRRHIAALRALARLLRDCETVSLTEWLTEGAHEDHAIELIDQLAAGYAAAPGDTREGLGR